MVFNKLSKKFQGRVLRKVLRVFQDSFKGVSKKIEIQWGLRYFERTSKGISGEFQMYFKNVSRVFQDSFKGVSMRLKCVSREISVGFKGI